jgi:hypothetical protein
MASRNGDKAVSAMAAVIEYSEVRHSVDGFARRPQRAVPARSSQNLSLAANAQLTTMIQMVDICCSLLEYDVNQSGQKLKVMQSLMDETLSDSNWEEAS